MTCSCTCTPQTTIEPELEDPIAEATTVESTKWAKLLAAIGFPYETNVFAQASAIELLDDDMIRELAVAWHDLGIADDGESSTEIEAFEDSIRMELGLDC